MRKNGTTQATADTVPEANKARKVWNLQNLLKGEHICCNLK
jgi:hypothetical protein